MVASYVGCALGARYLYFAALGEGDGHVQSVILCALLVGMGALTGLIGILADLIAVNRKLLEKLLARETDAATRPDSQVPGGPKSEAA